MSITLDSIRTSKASLPPRIILLGVEKIGKSTWASQTDKPIFIPIKGEEGIDELDVPAFPVAKSYRDVIDSVACLYAEPHEYETVVIDSATTLEPLIWGQTAETHGVASVEQVLGGFGKGYIESLTYWRELTDGLDALRHEKKMASIVIGHVKVKQFNDPTTDPYDQYQFDLQERAANMLYRWADCILFANKKPIIKEIKTGKKDEKVTHAIGRDEPFLFTRKRPAHPGGGRGAYGQLSYELPFTFRAFKDAVAEIQKF